MLEWVRKMSSLIDYPKISIVDSPLGNVEADHEGAAISGIRMAPSKAYAGIPALLRKVINDDDVLAWETILNKIDYIYDNIDRSLAGLDENTGFGREVKSQIRSGKKLFFKPNLVGPLVIDFATHDEGLGDPICTQWPLIAALMRWFHDKLDISYHQMALGEASTSTFLVAEMFSRISGKTITTEAIIEGRSGEFYGGWGFFFVRRYLAKRHPTSHKDDPMNGHEDSVSGRFLPPGRASDRLMVYDLNKLGDTQRGRVIAVPDGAIYKEISLHKAIVGGDPSDPIDARDYPGCVLANVPKLKMHFQDLITNAIKNLGIGLYPTQCPSCDGNGHTSWMYSLPCSSIPSYKGKLPHSPWILKMDEETNLPLKDENGEYIAMKTEGMSGTQADIIRAVQSQNVFMIHVVDAIDTINISHNPDGKSVRIPEGYVWSSLDCVALDLFCARYCFKTVPITEALKLKEQNGWVTEFVHHVPVASVKGKNIVTGEGLDSPLFRYNLYNYAENRGVGQQKYYVVGWDSLTQTPLASLRGHLGRMDDNRFVELMTKTMYYNPGTILHDLQETILSYAKANDELTGSSLLKEFMDSFDENHDGIIDYDEKGRRGCETAQFGKLAYALNLQFAEEYGALKDAFIESVFFSKYSRKDWNSYGHDFTQEKSLLFKAAQAFAMSQSLSENSDLFVPGMSWGKGNWPSWETVNCISISGSIYGSQSPKNIGLGSIYGAVFQYADKTLNDGGYTGSRDQTASDPSSINRYFWAVSNGSGKLSFTLYVPKGYGSLDGIKIPNVEETDDPKRIWTASFGNGKEIW